MSEFKKKYGLFLPKKDGLPNTSNQVVKKPSIFNEDSDSEEESNVDWVKKSLKKETYGGGALTRQSKADIQKVLAEDPTAYQYDEVYDELQKNINDSLAAKKTDRKPKYIQLLLAQAERRKRENERRLTRQIQKERENEGDEFADKEVFVTSAYKKKLEEMKKMDEQDKHMEMLEDIGDVMKQKDMTGFYRHIYRLTVAKEDLRDLPPAVKLEPKEDDQITKSSQPRQFRKRKSSESSASGDDSNEKSAKLDPPVEIKTEPNLDADSDLSDDEKSDNEETSKESEPNEKADNDNEKFTDSKDEKESETDTNKEDADENKENIQQSKPKVSIWVKRTVGEVFDAALERYYQRKAERMAAKGI